MELLSERKFTKANSAQFTFGLRYNFTAMIANIGSRSMIPSQSQKLDSSKQSLYSASEVAIDIVQTPELLSEKSELGCPKPRAISDSQVVLIPLLLHTDKDSLMRSFVIPISAGPGAQPLSTFIGAERDIWPWHNPHGKADLMFRHAPEIRFADHTTWDKLASIVKTAAWNCGLKQGNTRKNDEEVRR